MRLLLVALVALSVPVSAQTFASIHGGGVDFDLSGTGQTAVVEARAGTFVSRYLVLEGGLGISAVPEQFGTVTYALPSIELQVGAPILDSVRPFVGIGVGALVPVSDPPPFRRISGDSVLDVDYDPSTRSSLNVSVGVDAGLTPSAFGRVTGRLRSTGDGFTEFSGTFTELTIGLGVRL